MRRGAAAVRNLFGALGLFCCALCLARPAHAQAVLEERTGRYWVSHAVITTGSALLGFAAMYQRRAPMHDEFRFQPDSSVVAHYSVTAKHASDVLIVAEVLAPVGYFAFEGARHQVVGGLTIYAEAHAINFALNTAVKYAIRRPRPYTHHRNGQVRRLHDCPRVEDDCLSFYSGHSSTAFTSAIAGGYLMNETFAPSQSFRMLTWGTLMAGAAAAAHLRVRAGKHFYTDVVVGTLLGSGIGMMVPLMHGGSYVPSAEELGAAALGLAVGSSLPLLIPTDELPELSVTPAIAESAVGLSVAGQW
jgi:hypothetical protein